MDRVVLDHLRALPRDIRVYIYGAGAGGIGLAALLQYLRPDITILSFIDSFKSGRCENYDVISFDEFTQVATDYDLILISSTYWLDIVELLKRHNISPFQVVCQDTVFHESFMDEYFSNYRRVLSETNYDKVKLSFSPSMATSHPITSEHYQCAFVSECLRDINTKTVLDIGSWREFVLGLMVKFDVVSVDIRESVSYTPHERVFTCDASRMPFDDGSFDVITSMCAFEHFGLTHYGGELDFSACDRAGKEFARVLRCGGDFLVTIPVAQTPWMQFDNFKIFTLDEIHQLFSPFVAKKERIIVVDRQNKSKALGWGGIADITTEEFHFDVYCGWFRKN